MQIVRTHNLGLPDVKEKVELLLPQLTRQYGSDVASPEWTWQGNTMTFSFSAKGYDIRGALMVSETDIYLDLKLPFVARLFEGKIRSGVERKLDELLSG